ncbi:MAG: hypothetical protein ACT4P5_21345, partial [Armatimonadota bacterium]
RSHHLADDDAETSIPAVCSAPRDCDRSTDANSATSRDDRNFDPAARSTGILELYVVLPCSCEVTMPTVIECDARAPVLDVEADVDIAREPFFPDLERLYQRSTLLPAATGRVVGGRIKVTGRAEYIAWARAMGRPARVVIFGDTRGLDCGEQHVRVMSPEEAREEEAALLAKPAWKIYRFERVLSVGEQKGFVESVESGLSVTGRARLCSRVSFFDQGRAAEFLAFVPPYDDSSRRMLQASVVRFSQETVKIEAFNGHRFMPSAPG